MTEELLGDDTWVLVHITAVYNAACRLDIEVLMSTALECLRVAIRETEMQPIPMPKAENGNSCSFRQGADSGDWAIADYDSGSEYSSARTEH
jgi:hypothetical protein